MAKRLPRWTVEGLAQLAGYYVTGTLFPEEAERSRGGYANHGYVSPKSFFAWATPPDQLTQRKLESVADLSKELMAFINSGHLREKALYGTALEVMLSWTGMKQPAVLEIINAIVRDRHRTPDMVAIMNEHFGPSDMKVWPHDNP